MPTTITLIPFHGSSAGKIVWLDPGAAEAEVRQRARPAEKPEFGLSVWQVTKVARFIDENIEKRIRVCDLGGLVRLSSSRFSKCFRISVGQSPYNFILSRRIDAAKRLLATTDEPLCQVALACGLCDQSHLSNVFKRLVGVTPLTWRRRQLHSLAVIASLDPARSGAASTEYATPRRTVHPDVPQRHAEMSPLGKVLALRPRGTAKAAPQVSPPVGPMQPHPRCTQSAPCPIRRGAEG